MSPKTKNKPFILSFSIFCVFFILSACQEYNLVPIDRGNLAPNGNDSDTGGGSGGDTGDDDGGLDTDTDGDSGGDTGADPGEEVCTSVDFQQPEGSYYKKTDLLIVADTSGSLSGERADIVDNITAYTDNLPSDVHFKIAVLQAHLFTEWAGKLYDNPQKDDPLIIDSKLHDAGKIDRYLDHKLNYPINDGRADGGEVGLLATKMILTGTHYSDARAQGFFRDDAALTILYLSDENAICAEYPEGITPVPDTPVKNSDGSYKLDENGNLIIRENEVIENNCQGWNQTKTYDLIQQVYSDRPSLVGSIIYTDPSTVPEGGENEVGYGLLELTQMAGGILIDILSEDYSVGLSQIGSKVTELLELISKKTLEHDPVVADSIKVRVDGALQGHKYNANNNTVELLNPGKAKSSVKIDYCYIKPRAQD